MLLSLPPSLPFALDCQAANAEHLSWNKGRRSGGKVRKRGKSYCTQRTGTMLREEKERQILLSCDTLASIVRYLAVAKQAHLFFLLHRVHNHTRISVACLRGHLNASTEPKRIEPICSHSDIGWKGSGHPASLIPLKLPRFTLCQDGGREGGDSTPGLLPNGIG